jgi:hypothetical protein
LLYTAPAAVPAGLTFARRSRTRSYCVRFHSQLLRRIISPRIITIKASAPDRRLGGVLSCSTRHPQGVPAGLLMFDALILLR